MNICICTEIFISYFLFPSTEGNGNTVITREEANCTLIKKKKFFARLAKHISVSPGQFWLRVCWSAILITTISFYHFLSDLGLRRSRTYAFATNAHAAHVKFMCMVNEKHVHARQRIQMLIFIIQYTHSARRV
uniref:Uncharacterized protein n=1 Tax=Cacopsylla melanoneura TaxID=428564 RepID=A0A8D8W5E7_9HEMI